jgi:Protein of unknown function (DUF2510)
LHDGEVQGPPVPGWYPDPGGTQGLRYWDGANWTVTNAPPPQQRSSSRPLILALVIIGAIALLLVLAFALLVATGVIHRKPGHPGQPGQPPTNVRPQPAVATHELEVGDATFALRMPDNPPGIS